MEVVMAEERRPGEPGAGRRDDEPRPGIDPLDPANDPAVERDPEATSRTTHVQTPAATSGRGGLIAAAVIAVVALIGAIIAMHWDWGDPQATQMPAAPAAVEEGAPAAGDDPAAAPTGEDTAAPAGDEAEPID
jgi:hypothetical protein